MDCDDEPWQLPVVRPPVALVDEDSASYWKALYELDAMAEINEFERHGFNEATWSVAHHDADGAASNERLLEVRLQRLPEHVLGSKSTCGNHRNQLVETAVSAAIGMSLVSAWYSFVLFLRMGSNWVKLLRVAPAVIANMCSEVSRGDDAGTILLST